MPFLQSPAPGVPSGDIDLSESGLQGRGEFLSEDSTVTATCASHRVVVREGQSTCGRSSQGPCPVFTDKPWEKCLLSGQQENSFISVIPAMLSWLWASLGVERAHNFRSFKPRSMSLGRAALYCELSPEYLLSHASRSA